MATNNEKTVRPWVKNMTGKDHWGDATPGQMARIQQAFGRWPVETPCVRKGCTHSLGEVCWNQAAPYPIATLQPCLYQYKVMELLPEPLSDNRRQWMHICLLAKLYRLSVVLHYSEISPYRNNLNLREPRPVEFDAYLFCLIYTVGRLIDNRGAFPARFSFLPTYDKADEFDWKFRTEDCRDRTFDLYEDTGKWEEEFNPFTDPEAYRDARALAARNPDRKPHRTLKLLYTQYDVPKFAPSLYYNAYQHDVIKAFEQEHEKYNIDPETNAYIRDSFLNTAASHA
ncbi:hypothetical protein PG996_015019 [Apiospora saccharicola]|uniref:Uncharacterized protein n=1 Tax=Apiospora saccharicola TaxID=335842 RepID=A0ABR1TM07_9PEZI